jgi:hypothetical protein
MRKLRDEPPPFDADALAAHGQISFRYLPAGAAGGCLYPPASLQYPCRALARAHAPQATQRGGSGERTEVVPGDAEPAWPHHCE